MQAAKANIRQADLNLEYCRVVSPVTGIAGIRQVTPGNLVGHGEATLLATVSNVNPMRVYVSISEREYLIFQRMRAEGRMKRGGELQLILADGSTFPGVRSHHHCGPCGRPEDRNPQPCGRVPESESPAATRSVRPCTDGGDRGGKCSPGAAKSRNADAKRQRSCTWLELAIKWRSAL